MISNDAWKGEHLIRNMKPVHKGGSYAIAKKINKRKAKHKRHSACLVLGCNAPLPKSNRSMVCRGHLHDENYCQCKRCLPKGEA